MHDHTPNPDHDHHHPDSKANVLTTLLTMQAQPGCHHCHVRRRLLPMPGTAWGWETFHERHCPEHEDNQRPVAVRVTEDFNGAEYMAAEGIWDASQDDPS